MVKVGRLLFEGQAQGRNDGPQADHDEKWKARDGWYMPKLRDQDLQDRQSHRLSEGIKRGPLQWGGPFLFRQVVIGGSSAASNTSVADTASSTPSALKISTFDGLLTRAIVFLTLKV